MTKKNKLPTVECRKHGIGACDCVPSERLLRSRDRNRKQRRRKRAAELGRRYTEACSFPAGLSGTKPADSEDAKFVGVSEPVHSLEDETSPSLLAEGSLPSPVAEDATRLSAIKQLAEVGKPSEKWDALPLERWLKVDELSSVSKHWADLVKSSGVGKLAAMMESSSMAKFSAMMESSSMAKFSAMMESSSMAKFSAMMESSSMAKFSAMMESSSMAKFSAMMESSEVGKLAAMIESSEVGKLAAMIESKVVSGRTAIEDDSNGGWATLESSRRSYEDSVTRATSVARQAAQSFWSDDIVPFGIDREE